MAKAKAQPDKVKQVLDKIKTDGLMPTVETVFKRLDEPLPLGYCNVGVVQRTEDDPQITQITQIDEMLLSNRLTFSSSKFRVGDRVVSNGPHAEVVCVPENLCARIPDGVTDEEATFTVLGAIGLEGIRLANPTLGEKFVVFGAGLIGLLTVQLLRASGCDVLAVDLNQERLALAQSWGAEICNVGSGDPVAAANAWTEGVGVDGVLITASAKTDAIVHQAAEMCRKRGRIVLVGVVGLNLRRADFYEKELSFQVSCSYGPGRYDNAYEQKGQDYPIGYVRWTEQRNFEAVLGMMASGRLDVGPLITDRVRFEDAEEAYAKILNDPSVLGVILEYDPQITQITQKEAASRKDAKTQRDPQVKQTREERTICVHRRASAANSKVVAAMIGAGNFAKMTMGPALAKTGARLKYVSARTNGAAAAHIARKYGFENATTDVDGIWEDPEVNAVFIATGHNSHAALVCRALEAGKHVFVEKPLCLNLQELEKIKLAADTHRCTQIFSSADSAEEKQSSLSGNGADLSNIDRRRLTPDPRPSSDLGPPTSDFRQLMVGFNRRFSLHVTKIKELLKSRGEPLAMNITVNAGVIPKDVWVHDPEVGGGRIIGEACHFMDLLAYICGSRIVSVASAQMGKGVAVKEDKMSIVLSFEDGSIGTVNYFGNGSKSYPKEILEVFSDGRVLRLNNFRKLEGFGFKGFKKFKTWKMDKGHQTQFNAFVERVEKGGEVLIPFEEMVNVTLASFAAVASARTSSVIRMSGFG
ncbi:MAG: bi-domain-containing oxidoreductase [Deltaproteobacteria bacterium]|nr:bi-domain-containing oxidoreductase [Deltaproteobacteria bacterium]